MEFSGAMTWIVLLLVVLPFIHSIKHTLTYFITVSSGPGAFPPFVTVSTVDGVNVEYCDSNKRPEPRQDWVQTLNRDDPEHRERHVQACVGLNKLLTSVSSSIQLHLNQSRDAHVFQEMFSCSMDDETGAVDGSDRFGYDGEDFVSLDLRRLAWLYAERAASYRDKWTQDNNEQLYRNKLINRCPECLERFVTYGKSFLEREVPPSVSVLQKSPSSPISCFATGFYPNRADMFWRRDGEQTHEDVDHGEILPNPDGTFQMRVDLNLSSVRAQDWSSYDCVFRGSGSESDIVTRLDRAGIRTNWELPVAAVVAAGVGLMLLLLVGVTGLFISRRRMRRKGFSPTKTSDSSSSSSSSDKNE